MDENVVDIQVKQLQEEVKKLKKDIEDKDWASEKTNEAIRILYKELEKKNEQLKMLDQLKSQFVANVSHEFKNPLGVIKEGVSIILEGLYGPINVDQRHWLEMSSKTVDRLVRLVTDLLDLAKIESGKMELKRDEVDLVPFLDDILASYTNAVSKKQQVLKTDFPSGVGSLWADKDKLTQVIVNLLSNAIKYTPDGGQLEIRIQKQSEQDQLRIEFVDNGPGIPAEYREKIFDKFERITTEKQEGTGLGLPIAKDIVALHKGKIWVESEAGKGSKFVVVLPRDAKK